MGLQFLAVKRVGLSIGRRASVVQSDARSAVTSWHAGEATQSASNSLELALPRDDVGGVCNDGLNVTSGL